MGLPATDREPTAYEVGRYLTEWIDTGLEELDFESKRERQEARYLRAFLIDFTVSMTLGASPEGEAILAGYVERLQELSRTDRHFRGFTQELQRRLPTYTAAVKSEHPRGWHFAVSSAYSRLYHGDAPTMTSLMKGAVMVSGLVTALSDSLKQLEFADGPGLHAAPTAVVASAANSRRRVSWWRVALLGFLLLKFLSILARTN